MKPRSRRRSIIASAFFAFSTLIARPMRFNLASRGARSHGACLSYERRRGTRGVAAAVDADERGEDRDHGGAREQAQRAIDLQAAGDAEKERDCGQSAALADSEGLEQ